MANITIVDGPISYEQRNLTDGKKIRPKNGFKALYIIIKYGFKSC